jgi:hypothetical protein
MRHDHRTALWVCGHTFCRNPVAGPACFDDGQVYEVVLRCKNICMHFQTAVNVLCALCIIAFAETKVGLVTAMEGGGCYLLACTAHMDPLFWVLQSTH